MLAGFIVGADRIAVDEHPVQTVFFTAVDAVGVKMRAEDLVAADAEDGEDGLAILVVGVAVNAQTEDSVALARTVVSDSRKGSLSLLAWCKCLTAKLY